jgi:hypothetical protein
MSRSIGTARKLSIGTARKLCDGILPDNGTFQQYIENNTYRQQFMHSNVYCTDRPQSARTLSLSLLHLFLILCPQPTTEESPSAGVLPVHHK